MINQLKEWIAYTIQLFIIPHFVCSFFRYRHENIFIFLKAIYKYIVAKRLFGSFRFDQVEQVVVQARELDEEGLEYRLALVIPVDTLYKNGYPLIPPFYSGALVPEVAEKVRVIMNKEQVLNVDIPLIV